MPAQLPACDDACLHGKILGVKKVNGDYYIALRQQGLPQGLARHRAQVGRTLAFQIDKELGLGSSHGPKTSRTPPRQVGQPPDRAVPQDRPEPPPRALSPPGMTRDEVALEQAIERDRRDALGYDERFDQARDEDLEMGESERVPSAPLPQIEITLPEEARDTEHRPMLRAVDHPAGVQVLFYSPPPTDIRPRPRPGGGRPSYADGTRIDEVTGIRLPPIKPSRRR